MRRTFFHCLGGAVAATLVIIATATASQAQLEIVFSEGGGPIVSILDGDSLDSDGLVNGSITASPAVNFFLRDFTFTSLTATSNLLTGGPSSDAVIGVAGNVERTATGGMKTISIIVDDSPFGFPIGNPKNMIASATDLFSNTTAGDNRTLQSFFNVTPSPLLVFVPPVGAGPFSTGNPGVTTPLGTQAVGYTLSSLTQITLGPNAVTGVSIQSDAFSGGTRIHGQGPSVPEPGALALLGGLAVPGVFLLRRRR